MRSALAASRQRLPHREGAQKICEGLRSGYLEAMLQNPEIRCARKGAQEHLRGRTHGEMADRLEAAGVCDVQHAYKWLGYETEYIQISLG